MDERLTNLEIATYLAQAAIGIILPDARNALNELMHFFGLMPPAETLDDLRELARAQAEGRVFLASSRITETLYSYEINDGENRYHHLLLVQENATREEAEAALEEEKHEQHE